MNNKLGKLRSDIQSQALNQLKQQLRPAENLMIYYRCALMEIETKFNVLNEEFSIDKEQNPIETIKTRIKSPESILEKLNRKGLPYTVEAIEENLFDIAGVRVICPLIDDIYTIADCLLDQDDVFLISKKDYIKNPKPNGYRSLHLIVETPIFLKDTKRMMKVEIQLRTISMDLWASLEHRIRYKKSINPECDAHLSEVLQECAKSSAWFDNVVLELKDYLDKNNV